VKDYAQIKAFSVSNDISTRFHFIYIDW